MKKLISLTLIAGLLLSLFSAIPVYAGEFVTVGDLDFAIYENGTAVLAGRYFESEETDLVVPAYVRGCPVIRVSESAFESTDIESISLPSTVLTIEKNAFKDSMLESIYVPSSVTEIGYGAFENTPWLDGQSGTVYAGNVLYIYKDDGSELIKVRDGAVSVTSYAFSYCSDIREIAFPDSLEKISDNCFYQCSGLRKVTLGKNLKTIEKNAFSFCRNLREVNLSDATSLESAKSAFYGCSSLEEVTLPDSLAEMTDMFKYCTSLKKVTLGESVSSAAGAFRECTSLETMVFRCNTITAGMFWERPYSYPVYAKNLYFENTVKIVGAGAFKKTYFPNLENVTIHCESIGEGLTGSTCKNVYAGREMTAFDYNYNNDPLDTITIEDLDSWCRAEFTGRTIRSNTRLYFDGELIVDLVLPDTVPCISDCAFLNYNYLQSVIIPDSVTSIGDNAFCGTGIKTAVLPKSNVTIGSNAFSFCSELEEIHIYGSTVSIGEDAFTDDDKLTKIYTDDLRGYSETTHENYGSSPTDNFGSIYRKGERLNDLIIPYKTTAVESYTFYNTANISGIIVPDTVTRIGPFAFNTFIGSFEESSVLHESPYMVIPASVTEIGISATTGTIYGYPGSYAHTYAKNNYIEFFPIADYTDSDTGIIATAPLEYGLDADEIYDSDIFDKIASLDPDNCRLFNISLNINGTTVQPPILTTVRIPVSDPDSKVYRIEDDYSLTDMEAVYDNGYLIFVTDHFSYYAVGTDENGGAAIGDVNGDGNIDVDDVLAIQKHIAKLEILSGNRLAAADTDGNGTVDIRDATLLQKYIAKYDVTLG